MDYPKLKLIKDEENKETEFVIDKSRLRVWGAIEDIAVVRNHGELAGRALFLAHDYDYKIVKDYNNAICLIAIKKD